jgi:CheY-like chemotaxis protein
MMKTFDTDRRTTGRALAPMSRPGCVLLVEDDPHQRELLAVMLRADGFHVREASSGVELIEWIGRATSAPEKPFFDVIVSDIDMPDLTAMEVLHGWRAGWPVPLILVTASPDADVLHEAMALGASAVLAKPVRPEELSRAVTRALDGPGSRSTSDARWNRHLGGVPGNEPTTVGADWPW